MFEVRRKASVSGDRSPPIRQHPNRRLARVHHRLDREHHTFSQPWSASGRTIVRDLRLLVERRADPGAHELPNDRKPLGLDVGLFSIMKTVWQYDKSPGPLQLAEASIGAKGHVHAGPDGFRGTMTPEYKPPELTIEKLKRSLGL